MSSQDLGGAGTSKAVCVCGVSLGCCSFLVQCSREKSLRALLCFGSVVFSMFKMNIRFVFIYMYIYILFIYLPKIF